MRAITAGADLRLHAVTDVATGTSAIDADLAQEAAAGDDRAFEDLYRRYSHIAWRLAQAVAPSIDEAGKATTDGFIRVLRSIRRGRDDADRFGLLLLAAVYRSAANGLQPHDERDSQLSTTTPTAAGGGRIGSADQLVLRAFRALPQRWRGAVWVVDVEGLDITEAGIVLGVSSAAAVQLAKRGRAGLELRLEQRLEQRPEQRHEHRLEHRHEQRHEHRLEQRHEQRHEQRLEQTGGQLPLPDLAATLLSAVPCVPGGLAARSHAKWGKAMSSERRRSTPVAGWVTERAPRPLAACTLGLCAAGLIGLGVVGQHGGPSRTTPLGPIAAPSPAPVVPPGNGSGSLADLGLGLTAAPTPANPRPGGTGAEAPTTTTTTTTASSGASSEVAQGPFVVISSTPTPPAPIVPSVTITIPIPQTLPDLGPPATPAPTTTTTKVVAPNPPPPPVAQPVAQASANTGLVGVNLGVGNASCTGANLLGTNVGCNPPATGVSLTLFGQPLIP